MNLTPAAETLIHQLVIELHMQGVSLASLEIHFDKSRVPQSVNPKLHAITRGAPRQAPPLRQEAP